MTDNDSGDRGRDPFAAFWQDAMANSPFGMMGKPPADADDEMFKRMRQSFFDAWEKHCVEFMGSEQFLSAMKQSMDTAVAFRKQLNEFLTRTMSQAQIPTKADNDTIVEILRGIEESMTKRLDDISRRVAVLESAGENTPGKKKAKGASS